MWMKLKKGTQSLSHDHLSKLGASVVRCYYWGRGYSAMPFDFQVSWWFGASLRRRHWLLRGHFFGGSCLWLLRRFDFSSTYIYFFFFFFFSLFSSSFISRDILLALIFWNVSNFSGYYNPVLATGLKFGCRGHSHFEHFIVYWIGASLGALASIFAYPPLKNALGVKKLKEA